MAIGRNCFKVLRFDSEFSSRKSMLSGRDELQRQSCLVDSDDDQFDDFDSGAGSDDFDLLELGEVGEEFCQVGDQTTCIPFELYDLPSLDNILSMDVWNECLSEEERLSLTGYLPDMDQETFMRTLKELFTGSNLHFGSPITNLFDMLKGGLYEPRVALYRQGLISFQRCQHYHFLHNFQNSMVNNLHQMKNAWLSCRGYSIEEKLRVLNIMKSQKSLMYENMEEFETDSSGRDEAGEDLWNKMLKDWKHALRTGHHSAHGAGSTLKHPSHGKQMPFEQGKFGKQTLKGKLRSAGSKTSSSKEKVTRFPSVHYDIGMRLGSNGSTLAVLPRKNKAMGYGLGDAIQMRGHARGDDDAEEKMYEVAVRGDQNSSRVSASEKNVAFKTRKRHQGMRANKYLVNEFMGLPGSMDNDLHDYGSSSTVNKLSDIKLLTTKPSNARISYDSRKKVKYSENVMQFPFEEQMRYGKIRAQNLSQRKGNQKELSEPVWKSKAQGESFSVDSTFKYGALNVKSEKGKMERKYADINVNDRLSQYEYGAKLSQGRARATFMQNGGQEAAAQRGSRTYGKGEETESDSSEQLHENEDDSPLMGSKQAYPQRVRGSFMRSGPRPKRSKKFNKDKENDAGSLDGFSHSGKMADPDEHPHTALGESYSLKAKKKAKMHDDIGQIQNSAAKPLEDGYLSGRLNGDDNQRQIYEFGNYDQLRGGDTEIFHISSSKANHAERRQKGEHGRVYSVHQSSYLNNYTVDDEEGSLETHQSAEDDGVSGRLRKKGEVREARQDDYYERIVPLSLEKKWKMKEDENCDEEDDNNYMYSTPQQLLDDMTSSKNWRKRKVEDYSVTFEMETFEQPVAEVGPADVKLEYSLQKKPFTLITPTVHTGFSFSIIHLLSAVHMAMITMLPEDPLEVGKHIDKNDERQKLGEEQDRKQGGTDGVHFHENLGDKSEYSVQLSVPSLTVQEIVSLVRSNPGDPCILETQEPLQDLVRGVLKILSSKTAPLGAKGWKPLVSYEKSTRSWSWVGPVSQSPSDPEAVEEVTSPEAWGLPHKMLVKLVDTFANWLKNSQETLQQIGSLPAPPLSVMQFNLDEKERFRDLRAQKSLSTINTSSEEVRTYFRKEEVLRYLIPDRAFSYTAADGRKSVVAPLRRGGGKPTSKARDHFMLKRDRPPHVTILCLVRDAAARLPGSIGTRADVCTLIRDSQYIEEDVSDAQVNQVVSGALDRLHYERDPCVQFDGEKKLWVYLHREREEEDFEDDGTSSTKKWKRQKRDAAELFDKGTVTVAYYEAGEQTGFGLSSDLDVGSQCIDEDKRMELI
ncbi:uncharacterized protein LOC127797021 [Diospyros lotus]|uniref:uncharacterized protein LOC127797021 n=1 Tax=Diospyros lotus TaxID=55363 RepID=UPI002251E290|nr:uncharacterized protein LOC127797021 [Diospyros lotus]XP_052185423.1 uncharacterized protein LOC127797021 [Diospyros lotus]XP_052185424.1 uncharacterized protein LOC127797021 [Diospyros lotus]XP_052185425.1 uncharacterized protein LOC127797021 [Diospyros lotus]XP_052185426.1 uncharacterized protein LOC127797021 [Diospyros lotus]XP_052185428.1 uncharacterized protein LOC127797021 [Diospyros lotus]XP_052185429.1 uncharacterized protein LOC127797021 [Diospyros lotus]XP_052185430.1 uncharacte